MDINKAKEIVSTLAEGIDPTTGEILPDNSVCNKAEVVRALYTVLAACCPTEALKKTISKEPSNYDVALYEQLKKLRNRIAEELGLLPFRVLPNLSLKHLALRKPTTLEEFMKTYGIGKYTAKQYGEAFLNEIKDYISKQI